MLIFVFRKKNNRKEYNGSMKLSVFDVAAWEICSDIILPYEKNLI